MKHMVVNTHNAESCAFRSEEDGKALTGAMEAFKNGAKDRGLTVEGFWINRAAHTFYILVDGPSAHAVEDALQASGLIGRTHSDVISVMSEDEVRAAFEARQ
jgi:hypothetical protein